MANIFISGATGYIGAQLSLKLAAQGQQVRALVRNPEKMKYIRHPNISGVEGSLHNVDALQQAMAGCSEVYHIAALAGVWHPDPQAFYKINVEGSLNILEAARRAGARRVVLTSTAGVMGPTPDGNPVHEHTNAKPNLTTAYEQSKLEAEQKTLHYAEQHGLELVIVNPSRVYGPGQWSESNGVTKMIRGYAAGTWRLIPGDGHSIGNYVFIDDVLNGHLLAMEKGRPGERYILGGENASYIDFFETLAQLTGRRHSMFRLPLGAMLAFAHLQQFLADSFGRRPMITPPFVRKFVRHWPLSSEKAERDLGYTITSLEEGIRRTLAWLGSGQNDRFNSK
ncbi:MAG: NAD-dependent epimerase/dehydratase family protein [Lewinellaceae bacterium]|nr:NAD-dependent epimerase/dehydratase family protein [Lewinellaceae bacterium]